MTALESTTTSLCLRKVGLSIVKSSGALVEIYAAFSGIFVGLSPTGTAQPLPQFDENLRRLDIQNDGSLLMLRGPGQPRLDSGVPQQAGFPCQVL